jgi:hypothetical protein
MRDWKVARLSVLPTGWDVPPIAVLPIWRAKPVRGARKGLIDATASRPEARWQ